MLAPDTRSGECARVRAVQTTAACSAQAARDHSASKAMTANQLRTSNMTGLSRCANDLEADNLGFELSRPGRDAGDQTDANDAQPGSGWARAPVRAVAPTH